MAVQPMPLHRQTGDDVIEAAWERRLAARQRYNALPYSEAPGEAYTPEETACWAIMDGADEVIRSTIASTPRGAAVQMWAMLLHSVDSRDDEEAAMRRDLAHFDRDESRLDKQDRLALAVLRSLQTMEG